MSGPSVRGARLDVGQASLPAAVSPSWRHRLEQSVEHGEQAQRSNGGRLMCLARQPVRNTG